ncbi:MAG: methyltransferase domain-containing protein [Chloroflexi bacterium]|nr:methyltransferase domain-containing protein [Chloroflexota bacterium]
MTQAPQEEIQKQAGKVLQQVAGYVGVRTIDIGLKHGLLEELSKHSGGLTSDELAQNAGIDPFYAMVWCRSAYANEILEREGERFVLAPHMDKLLLDDDFPGHVGGLPAVLLAYDIFDRFSENLKSGERSWWDKCTPEFIQGVRTTGRSFYNRLIPAGVTRVPGLLEQLEAGAHVLELATGAGFGISKMAQTYPKCTFVGVDGDAYSLGLAAQAVKEAGASDRVELVESTFEGFTRDSEFDVAVISISMHECRDIEKVTANVHGALKPGGCFVISDFPFPETVEETRTVPARIMSGIQFFEALIDDQLLPTSDYVSLLKRHDFKDVDAFDITPVHAVTHGRK